MSIDLSISLRQSTSAVRRQRTTPQRSCIAAAAIMTIAGAALLNAGSAYAAEVPAAGKAAQVAYQLPALPLADALAAIERDFHVSVEVDKAQLAGHRSQPVVGLHTAASAVAAALAGTELSVGVLPDGRLKVAQISTLDRVVVVGAKRNQAEVSFKADYSSTTARNGVSLQETPAGVTVVTSKVIESQQATSVLDVLNNVSSVVVTPSSQGPAGLSIRGFGNAPLLSDGTSATAYSTVTIPSLPAVAVIERLEVLKGPQAILAGAGVLGGAVNVVTKKPQEDPIHTVSLQRTVRDGNLLTADFSNAVLADDKRLSYRLISSASTERKSASGFDGQHASLLAPSLRWKDRATDLTVSYTNSRERSAPNRWTSSVDGVIQPEPKILPGNASDGADLSSNKFQIDLDQKLPWGLTLVSRLQRATNTQNLHLNMPLFLADPSTQTFGMMPSSNEARSTTTSGDHYLRLQKFTGPVEHKLAFGMSHIKTASQVTNFVKPDMQMVSLADPATTFQPMKNQEVDSADSGSYRQRGTYVQDFMRWESTSLLVGVRSTKFEADKSYHTAAPGRGPSFVMPGGDSTATSSNIGLLQAINDNLSLYAMTAKGYLPNQGRWCGATPTDPSQLETRMMGTLNKEIGAKLELLNGKLAVTGGLFDLQQTGRPIYVANRDCNMQIDGQRDRGLDIDVQGELSRGLNVIANFTVNNLKGIGNPPVPIDGQPKRQGSVWLQYALPWQQVQGMAVGFGVSSHGSSTAGAAYQPIPTQVPAWTRLDASLFYDVGAWSTTLGIKNLTGKRIYGYSPTPTYIPVINDGREVRLTAKYSFQ